MSTSNIFVIVFAVSLAIAWKVNKKLKLNKEKKKELQLRNDRRRQIATELLKNGKIIKRIGEDELMWRFGNQLFIQTSGTFETISGHTHIMDYLRGLYNYDSSEWEEYPDQEEIK